MKKLLVASAVAGVLSLASAARAVTFDWSYSGGGLSGGGTLQAIYDGGVTYTITSISGLANGVTISGLTSYDGPDQFIFYPNPPNVVVDGLGFSFGVGDGSMSYNIYQDGGLYTPGSYYSCVNLYCILGPGPTDGSNIGPGGDVVTPLDSLTLTLVAGSVPEPSTWAIMLLGFAGLGVLAYRKRAATAAAA